MRAQCCICSDLFENSASINIAAAPCGHTFHEMCLMRWMNTSSTCPSCRTHIKKNQIIKRLFFDINEDFGENEDLGRLLNQIGNLKVQLCSRDKDKQELAEARDVLAVRLASCESDNEDLKKKLSHERTINEVSRRDFALLQQENAVYVEGMKDFRRTKEKLVELQNVETLLKGCDSDIQKMISQYSEGGESSLKQLSSLATVMKQEYSQALADKKIMRERVSKLKTSVGHHHSEVQHLRKEVSDLKVQLELSQENLIQLEKENNNNRRKVAHLRSALKQNKTEGSQSFHRALDGESPNTAYTPPKLVAYSADSESELENLESSFDSSSACLTPDLFSPPPKSVSQGISSTKSGPKLKFVNVPTAAEKFLAVKKAKLELQDDDTPHVPKTVLNIMKKKLTGQSNSRTHVDSVITRGYDGFGGSTTFVQPTGLPKNTLMKMATKRNTSNYKLRKNKVLVNQPRLKECVNRMDFSSGSHKSSTHSSSLSSSSSSTCYKPKLSPGNTGFIDLT